MAALDSSINSTAGSSTTSLNAECHELEKQHATNVRPTPFYRRPLILALAFIAAAALFGTALGLGVLSDQFASHRLTTLLARADARPPPPSPTRTLTEGTVSSYTVGAPYPVIPIQQLVDPSQFILSPTFDTKASPQTREYSWTVSEVIAAPGGINRRMLVVNGKYPGPTIEANLGDRIVVHVTNKMSNITTIHWHGQLQNGTNWQDGVFATTECGIAPNTTYTYSWVVQLTGTYWWHAHTGALYNDGLIGALILHGRDDVYGFRSRPSDTTRPANVSYDGDIIVMVNDLYNLFSTDWVSDYLTQKDSPVFGAVPLPDYGVMNGIGQANCSAVPAGQTCERNGNAGLYSSVTVAPRRRYRLRVINSGALVAWNFSVDAHTLNVIEVDGTEVFSRPAQSVAIDVAQRTSVIIETDQRPGAYFMRSHMLEEDIPFTLASQVKDQKMVMRYSGISSSITPNLTASPPTLPGSPPRNLNTDTLTPIVSINPPPATKQITLDIDFAKDAEENNELRAYFNGSTFGRPYPGYSTIDAVKGSYLNNTIPVTNGLFVTTDKYEVIDLIVNNHDPGSHPMHLHGFVPYILGSGPGDYPAGSLDLTKTFVNPMRRDVYTMQSSAWAVIRFVADNPGEWVYHCHLSSHMAAGLIMTFSIQPAKVAQFTLPADHTAECNTIRSSGITAEA
ncbi:unnamed protein product [Tilletia laevis]|uniref:Laccase n=2 Tax=Tilletia TaxID=13289 RepID=A0A8X7MVJ1_9BASI|nr:hypothetical protein A4X06_0g2895 [Tilletia controversa]CAD6885205.1 unnamed protein product [Tilletia caries]CAD6948785.1 unnamed protein product [Tilletia laevis]CAD6919926.1 unnamed protein product [Tilletia caries]CAD6955136.1 unnamed protein product [Tilletia laevis]